MKILNATKKKKTSSNKKKKLFLIKFSWLTARSHKVNLEMIQTKIKKQFNLFIDDVSILMYMRKRRRRKESCETANYESSDQQIRVHSL